ncbi:MAG: hypothetical protein DVB23_003366 [Verrucomicrobia bacterium]|nr:MAG: hypothetical protein DVB23_003366 [Verrucomicrobiota bacterium]
MQEADKILQRIAAAARRDESSAPSELPFGLATRVIAKLREGRAPSLWESLALGALPVAVTITVACILWGAPPLERVDDPETIARVMLQTQLSVR